MFASSNISLYRQSKDIGDIYIYKPPIVNGFTWVSLTTNCQEL